MLLGNLALTALLKEGSLVYNGAYDGTDFGLALHLDNKFWYMRPKKSLITIGKDNPIDQYEYKESTGTHVYLRPNSMVLGTTVETLGSNSPNFAAIINTRSTLARYGIAVHTSALMFAPGFISKWTLELINNTPYAITVPVGAEVAMAYFMRVEDNTFFYSGAYGSTWTVNTMLPKQGNI